MPLIAPVVAAGAALVLAGKLMARFAKGLMGQRAIEDPPGIRTVAHFTTTEPVDRTLRAIAHELRHELEPPVEVIEDAVRVHPPGGAAIDIVRVIRRSPTSYTLELTRAFTGIHLDDNARAVLARIHAALGTHVTDLLWYARQDRAFGAGDPFPCDPD